MGKAFAVYFMPLFMLVMHLFVIFMASLEPKVQKIGKVSSFIYRLIPDISLWVQTSILLNSLNLIPFSGASILLLIGFIFLVIGNYLPKTGQNNSVGIKIPWTLDDE